MNESEFTGKAEPWKGPDSLAPLTAKPHWLVWKLKAVPDKAGKPKLDKEGKPKFTKVPYQPNGALAKSDDPRTWSDFDTAARAASNFDGIGFAPLNSGVAAFDIDDCRDPNTGVVHPWADALVDAAGSYAEITPSGNGLRILGYGKGAEVHRKLPVKDGVTCELYRQATRYITVSGNVYRDAPLVNIDEHIDRVLAELDERDKPKPKEGQRKRGPKRELTLELRALLGLQGDPPPGYPSRSELLWAFINAALRAGVDENVIVEVCLDQTYEIGAIHQHVADNGDEEYIKKQIEHAINRTDLSAGERRIIRLEPGQLHHHWRDTEEALMAAGCPVYRRADSLVQPLWCWESDRESNRRQLTCKLVEYSEERLSDVVAHHAVQFQKFDERRAKWRNVDPPDKLIKHLLKMKHWGFYNVIGIVNAPTMRYDGSLITKPGYDKATQLWYKPAADIEPLDIPEHPTKADAEKALQRLAELIQECAFADKPEDQTKANESVDRSVALAAMMTVVLRGAFPYAPLFLFHKPQPRTGGSYLVKIIATLALGRDVVPLAVSDDPKELDKELVAAAYEAKPLLNLNNLSFNLNSAKLCQIITEGQIEFRPFGENTKTLYCDCRAMTVIANGNNINVAGDLVERTMASRLDAKLEEPETRVFEHDPIAKIQKSRSQYLADVFTIARAFMNSDAQSEIKGRFKRLNGFEGWSKFVQQPLVWLGVADPAKSLEATKALDPKRNTLRDMINALTECVGGVDKEFTAAKVYDHAMERASDPQKLRFPALIAVFSRDGKNVSPKSIGRHLMNNRGIWTGDHCIELVKGDSKLGHTYQIIAKPKPQSESPAAAAQTEEPQSGTPKEEPF